GRRWLSGSSPLRHASTGIGPRGDVIGSETSGACALSVASCPASHERRDHTMTAEDTSREALIEQVARRIHEAADYEVPVMPWDQQTDDWRAEVSSLAAAVVDAVVMPLVQERDAAR